MKLASSLSSTEVARATSCSARGLVRRGVAACIRVHCGCTRVTVVGVMCVVKLHHLKMQLNS